MGRKNDGRSASGVAVAADGSQPEAGEGDPMGCERERVDRAEGADPDGRGVRSGPLANVSKPPARELSRPYDGTAERAHYGCGEQDVRDVERVNIEAGERRRPGRPVKNPPPAHAWVGRCARCNGIRAFNYPPAWQPDLFRHAERRRGRKAPGEGAELDPGAAAAQPPLIPE